MCINYINCTYYYRLVKNLDVWTDKRKSLAQNLDNLDDVFRPAMRASWLSYIHSVYGEEAAPGVGLIEGENPLVVAD